MYTFPLKYEVADVNTSCGLLTSDKILLTNKLVIEALPNDALVAS
jgi:hypothetical protein